MNTWNATVKRIWSEMGSVCSELEIDHPPTFQPGQYFLLNDASPGGAMVPNAVYPIEITSLGIRIAPPTPTGWAPGLILSGQGPLGNGFHIPAITRKISLVCYHSSPQLILSLASKVQSWGGEANLFWDLPLDTDTILPFQSSLEILPTQAVDDAFLWADMIAIDVPFSRLDEIRTRREKTGKVFSGRSVEVLIRHDMSCGGMGDCGVCSIPTRKGGWKLVCKDGPVFNWDDLAAREG
jgi:NAD(P)H-flavin reductase